MRLDPDQARVRQAVSRIALAALSDAALLEGVVRDRDEDAFAALVGRHGPGRLPPGAA